MNSARPVISRSGRTSTAASWCMSMANHVMPWCFGASGFVRATSMPMSAICPPDVQTFWPLTIHSSPSRTARVREAGEVGAGAGLAEQLAPRPLAGHDRADELLDLLRRAVGGDRRGGQRHAETGRRPERAVLGDAGRHGEGVGTRHALAVGALGQCGVRPPGRAEQLPPLRHGEVGVPVGLPARCPVPRASRPSSSPVPCRWSPPEANSVRSLPGRRGAGRVLDARGGDAYAVRQNWAMLPAVS